MTKTAETQEFRYERKFLLERFDRHRVKSMVKIHPAMFTEIHHPRTVNNLYLDSINFDSYSANVVGISERTKARIRWYGRRMSDIENPLLEFKIKRGFLGRKDRYPLESFVLDETFSSRYFRNFIRNSDLPGEVKASLAALDVVLLNRYFRSYYISADKKFRITIDSGMSYYKIAGLRNNFLSKQVDYDSIVVELKYMPEDDNLAERIISAFPFRVTKNSKYVQGIERTRI